MAERTDTERLDWYQANTHKITTGRGGRRLKSGGRRKLFYPRIDNPPLKWNGKILRTPNLRRVIDAIMDLEED